MGYNTHFEIKLEGLDKLDAKELVALLKNMGSYFGYYIGEEYIDTFLNQPKSMDINFEGKFYDWNDCFIRLTNLFPKLQLTVSGHGEEKEDIWKAYFKGGVVQLEKPEIIFKPCNLW